MYKAGMILKYGLEEVYYGKISKNNLKVFLVYYTLMGYMDRRYTVKLKKLLTQRDCMFFSDEKKCLEIQENIVENLKRALEADSQDELFQKCDSIMIPQWVYDATGFLYESLPAVYLVDSNLYYFETDSENRRCFRCSTGYFVEDEIRFDFYEDDELLFNVEMLSTTLSTMYADVLGYDEKKKLFYLKMEYTEEMYALHRVEDMQTMIFPYSCYGVLENRYPVIKKDGFLSIVNGNKIVQIKKWSFYESYCISDDLKHIVVEPKKYVPVIFKPYLYDINGNRIEMEQRDLAKALFSKIVDETVMAKYLFGEFDEKLDGEKNELDNMEIEVFSLQMLDDFFHSKYVGKGDKNKVEPYSLLVQILSYYLNRDESVLDLFYLLADASVKWEEDNMGDFISMKVVSRLNELHLSGELEGCVQNFDTLREKLLKNVYWNAEKLNNHMEEDIKRRARLGCFEFFDGKMEACSIGMEDARYHAGQLAMKGNPLAGIVSYNLDRGEYEINYNRILSKNELQKVVKYFRLFLKKYRIIVEMNNE